MHASRCAFDPDANDGPSLQVEPLSSSTDHLDPGETLDSAPDQPLEEGTARSQKPGPGGRRESDIVLVNSNLLATGIHGPRILGLHRDSGKPPLELLVPRRKQAVDLPALRHSGTHGAIKRVTIDDDHRSSVVVQDSSRQQTSYTGPENDSGRNPDSTAAGRTGVVQDAEHGSR